MPHLLPTGVDDSRSLGQKFRRVELQQILMHEEVWDDKKHGDMPKDSMSGSSLLDVVKANNVDLNKYIALDGTFTLTSRKVDAGASREDQLSAEVEELKKQMAELTKPAKTAKK